MGRTTRDGLSIDFPDRLARCHLLQQDRQRAWRTHYGRGNPRRTAETKTLELTIDDVRLALAGFLHAGDRGIIIRDGGRLQGVHHDTPSVCPQALSRTLSTHLDSTFPAVVIGLGDSFCRVDRRLAARRRLSSTSGRDQPRFSASHGYGHALLEHRTDLLGKASLNVVDAPNDEFRVVQ